MSDRANQLICGHPAPDPRGDRRERRHLRGVPGRQAVVHRRRRGRRVAAVRRRLHRARRRGAGVRQPRRARRARSSARSTSRTRRCSTRRSSCPTAPTSPATATRVSGRVTDVDGKPLADANLDIWQADAEGRYSGFMPGPPEGNLRGQVRTDADGRYEVRHRDPRAVHDPARRPDGQDDRRRRLEPVAPGAHPPDRQRRGLRAAGHPAVHRLQRLPRQRRRERGQARADRAPRAEPDDGEFAFTYDFALAPARTPAVA